MGLAFDDWDLDYYTALFKDDMKRDPTNVELFDIAQSNSEHSRHWFFRGDIVIDGEKMPNNLFNMVKEPWKVRPYFPLSSLLAVDLGPTLHTSPALNAGQPQQQRRGLQGQLVGHPRLQGQAHAAGAARRPVPADASGPRLGPAAHRRDAQLPVRSGALPG